MELGFMELMRTAAVIVDDCLKIQPGEKVVVTADSRNHEYPGQEPMIQALMAVMAERDLDPTLVFYEGRYLTNADIPEIAAFAIGNADVVIGVNSTLLLQSQVMKRLWAKNHVRLILLPSGVNITWSPDEIYRMMPRSTEELMETSELGRRLYDKLVGTPKIHLTAANGTDITIDFVPDKSVSGGLAVADGICDKPGMMTGVPGGGVTCLGGAGDVNGKIVLDAEIALYNDLLPDAATLTYENGKVVSIEGDGITAGLVRDYLAGLDSTDPTNEMPEFGMGTNKRAQLNGNSSEGISVYGSAHVGIGFLGQDHFDAVIPKATVEVNGELVLKDGEYV